MAGSNGTFSTYLFDLDGTLLDSIELIFRCYRYASERHLSAQPPERVWRDGLGTPLRAQFGEVTTDTELIERMVETYREYHVEHHDEGVSLYPGVEALITALAAKPVKLGLVTSKLRRGAERGLRVTGLVDYFDVIVTADDVERAKPDPEPVLTALAKLDADSATTVFVGDSPHDIASGRAAGVATAGVLWGPFDEATLVRAAPTFLLKAPADLLDV